MKRINPALFVSLFTLGIGNLVRLSTDVRAGDVVGLSGGVFHRAGVFRLIMTIRSGDRS